LVSIKGLDMLAWAETRRASPAMTIAATKPKTETLRKDNADGFSSVSMNGDFTLVISSAATLRILSRPVSTARLWVAATILGGFFNERMIRGADRTTWKQISRVPGESPALERLDLFSGGGTMANRPESLRSWYFEVVGPEFPNAIPYLIAIALCLACSLLSAHGLGVMSEAKISFPSLLRLTATMTTRGTPCPFFLAGAKCRFRTALTACTPCAFSTFWET
jgi:hypothetical protein